jgi:hypothetical protein
MLQYVGLDVSLAEAALRRPRTQARTSDCPTMIPPDQALRLVAIDIACSLGNGGEWQDSCLSVIGKATAGIGRLFSAQSGRLENETR